MKKEPKHAQELRRIGAAETFIDARLALGRVAFSLADLVKESGLSAIAAKRQLSRLVGKVVRVSPRQPFFLIVGPEHRSMGAPICGQFVWFKSASLAGDTSDDRPSLPGNKSGAHSSQVFRQARD